MTSLVDQTLQKTLITYPDCLIVTSPRFLGQVASYVKTETAFLIGNADLSEAKRLADSIVKQNIKMVLAFGSGKVIDTAKYAVSLSGTSLVAVPACLSTNCCFTDKSTLFDNGDKHTLNSKVPGKVVFDWEIIQQNNFMNTCGVIELLSSCTALTDWQIANDKGKEPIDHAVYEQAKKIVISAQKLLDDLSVDNLKKQNKMLIDSGNLAVRYGCGRPVSGSDHILSSFIENHYRCPHGVALSISIPIMLSVQKTLGYKSNYDDVLLKLTKNNPFKKYIKQYMDIDTIMLLLSKVVPRQDRYTVINLIKNQELLEIVAPILDDIFS